MKPYMFLDFDGVVNALPYERRWVGPASTGHMSDLELMDRHNWVNDIVTPDVVTHFPLDTVTQAVTNGRTYKITYSSELVDALRELIAADKVNFLWATTWRNDAVTEINPILNFPGRKTICLNWQDTTVSVLNPQIGKYFGITDFLLQQEKRGLLELDTPLIWVDDEATTGFYDLTDEQKNSYRTSRGRHPFFDYPNLVVKPDSRWGISRAELARIQNFVN